MALMRPQDNASIPSIPGKVDTGHKEALAQPVSAQFGLDKEEAQLCRVRIEPHTENASCATARLCDPAPLVLGIVPIEEVGEYRPDEGFERIVKACLPFVEFRVPCCNPVSVAATGSANGKGLSGHRLRSTSHWKGSAMSIDTERDISANLQIGPTSGGMVRFFVEAEGVEIPLDFEPDEAEEIAEEIRASASRARKMRGSGDGTKSRR
jgi:hypothetical protein